MRNYNTALPPIIITRYRFGDKTGTPRFRSTPAVRSASIQRSIIGTARYRWTVKILFLLTWVEIFLAFFSLLTSAELRFWRWAAPQSLRRY
jgi:hypothetical protein